MIDLQRAALDWIVAQPPVTGLAVLGGGLLCALAGARFTRFLVTVCAVAAGSVLGLMLSVCFNVAPVGMSSALAFAAGFAAILWPATMLIMLSGFGWGFLALYYLHQLGSRGDATLVVFALGFLGGCVLTSLNRATMTVLLTSIVGSAVMVVGFIGLANGVLPSLGGTIRALAGAQPLTLPILIAMLTVTTYSYQANSFRGDIVTGGVAERTS